MREQVTLMSRSSTLTCIMNPSVYRFKWFPRHKEEHNIRGARENQPLIKLHMMTIITSREPTGGLEKSLVEFHNIVQSRGTVSWSWNTLMIIYCKGLGIQQGTSVWVGLRARLCFLGPWDEGVRYVYYSYIRVQLEHLGGVVFPSLCIGIMVHPRNICRKHCST